MRIPMRHPHFQTGPTRSIAFLLGILVAAAVALPAWCAKKPEGPPEDIRLTLLQLNDVYQTQPDEKTGLGGLARVASLARGIRQESPNTLFLFAGDTLAPSLASQFHKGRQMIAAWNALGVSAATLGNHEFDYGPELLKERVQESAFPWLAANVRQSANGKLLEGLKGYHVFLISTPEGQALRVGVLGLLTPETASTSRPGQSVQIEDPVHSAKTALAALKRERPDVVVFLTHLPLGVDRELARRFHPDIILGGHEHVVLQSLVGKTPIFKVGADAPNLGRFDLILDGKTHRLKHLDWNLIPVNATVKDDPAFVQKMAPYETEMIAVLNAVQGYTLVPLDGRQSIIRRQETNLGDLVTDAYRETFKTDIAIANSGSIRGDKIYPQGNLTTRDLYTMLPFGNEIRVLSLSGRQLLSVLEHSVSQWGNGDTGWFLQVSGLRFSVNPNHPVGERVSAVQVNGEPLRLEQSYTMALPNYLAEGGDGYTMLAGCKEQSPTGPIQTEAEVLKNYVRRHQEIRLTPVGGRIDLKGESHP